MKKLLLILLVLACGSGTGFAATETTVYYAIPADAVGTYTVKLNVNRKGDGDDWAQYTMTLTDKTYYGNYIYTYTYTDLYDGVGVMQFQLYDGETFHSQKVAYSSWTAVGDYNGKMYDHNAGWRKYNYDKTVTIHALKKDGWSNVYICNEFNDYDEHWDTQVAFPGTLGTQSTVNGDWYDLTVTGRPCTRVVTSNGSDGDGNRSGNNEIGDASEYWITYDGSSTTCTNTPPASFNYTRSITDGKFGTICLPYAATVTGAVVFKITSKTESAGNLTGINLESVDELEAGKAYIFKATSSTLTATLSGNYTAAAAGYGMMGTFAATKAPLNSYVIGGDNLIHKVAAADAVNVGAYKGYITLDGISVGARGLDYIDFFDNTTTGIETVKVDNAQKEIYNLAGQRVVTPAKGLYIVNGKKVIIK